ncbi:hypothetical protein PCE1_004769 [Barthelona sp. PCE]
MNKPLAPYNLLLVMCGSLNPITIAHLRLFFDAKAAFSHQYSVIKGILSPVNDAYRSFKFGKPVLIDGHHRVNMCRAATEDIDWITVDTFEMEQDHYVRTYEYLCHLTDEYPLAEWDIRFVCGVDLLSTFKPEIWNNCVNIINEFGFVAFERKGYPTVEEVVEENPILRKNSHHILTATSPCSNSISSTVVRDLVRRNDSPRFLVADRVLDYINNNQLYIE